MFARPLVEDFADVAELAEEIDIARAEAARKRAEIFSDALHDQFKEVIERHAQPAIEDVEKLRGSEHLDQVRSAVDETKSEVEGLKAAIDDAKKAAREAEFDPRALARAVMREAVDDKVKDMLQEAFAEGFRENSLPRISGKLAEVYAKKLRDAGLEDERAVKEVRAEIEKMLSEALPEATDAAGSGTKRLVADQHLDKADPAARKNRKREQAVAESFTAKASEITEAGRAQVTGSDSDDSRFVNLAERQGREGEGDSGYLTLWERVDTLASNVGQGRMGFLEGVDSAAIGGIRRTARALRGSGRHRGYYRFIRLVDTGEQVLVDRTLEIKVEDVPDWFVRMFPLEAPEAGANVMAGWIQAGTLLVKSHPGYAYQTLWQGTVRMTWW